jgi:hypothetical protein
VGPLHAAAAYLQHGSHPCPSRQAAAAAVPAAAATAAAAAAAAHTRT